MRAVRASPFWGAGRQGLVKCAPRPSVSYRTQDGSGPRQPAPLAPAAAPPTASGPRASRGRGRERRPRPGAPPARGRAVLPGAAPVRGRGARRLGARAGWAEGLDGSPDNGQAPGLAGGEQLVRIDLVEPADEVLLRILGGG